MGRGVEADHPEPRAKLVRFAAADGVELSGLLYEPHRVTERAVIFLHGTGGASIFDSRRSNLFGQAFVRRGLAFFPFNNRGAHLVRHLRRGRRSVLAGSAHEVIRDCLPDIEGAAAELRRRGYRDITLAGHSTGANKIAVYDHYKARNPIRRYVLIAGGDDTGLMYGQLGAARYRRALERARSMIRERRGQELVPRSVSTQMLSWRSFHDIANPDGDYNVFPFLEALRGIRLGRKPLFRHVRGIRKPAFFLYGGNDEYCYGEVDSCMSELADAIGSKRSIEIAVMKGADHGFRGRERELAEMIAGWIRRVV